MNFSQIEIPPLPLRHIIIYFTAVQSISNLCVHKITPLFLFFLGLTNIYVTITIKSDNTDLVIKFGVDKSL